MTEHTEEEYAALEAVVAELREENEVFVNSSRALEAQNRQLRQSLEVAVWRHRSDFPNDPYCFLCGAGKRWATEHGHEQNCALAPTEPKPLQCDSCEIDILPSVSSCPICGGETAPRAEPKP